MPAGQTPALVDTTGAGKSTVAKLATHSYDPTRGRVRLDGVGLRDLAAGTLHGAVVLVTQEKEATSSPARSPTTSASASRRLARRVESAAREIGAHGFISAPPDLYDTQVSNRGGLLSAGQRQLVTSARAFLADLVASGTGRFSDRQRAWVEPLS